MRRTTANAMSSTAALFGGNLRNDRLGALAGVTVLVALVVGDMGLGVDVSLTGALMVVPFITAVWAGPAATGAMVMLTLGAAAASGAWNDNFGSPDYDVRLALVTVGGVLALASAWARERGRFGARRLELLDQVGSVADGSLPLGQTLDRVLEVIVPSVADLCMVDAIHDTRVMRSAVRVRGKGAGEDRLLEERLRRRRPSVPEWMIDPAAPFPRQPRFIPRFNDEDVQRIAHGADEVDWLRSLGLRSAITVPMLARDRKLGALTVATAWSGRTYSMDDVRFAQVLAGRVALALDNAGLFSDLESVERRMDNVMSLLDEAVVILDASGEAVFANPAAARMIGLPADDDEALSAAAQRIDERWSVRSENGSVVPAGRLLGERALDGQATEPEVFRLAPLRGGSERWLIARAKPIEGPDGHPLYAVNAIEDVTAVKRAEFAQRLLARAGELFAGSTDYRAMLRGLADVGVPELADWCSVNVPSEEGTIDLLAAAHSDPAAAAELQEDRRERPVAIDGDSVIASVLREGKPLLLSKAVEFPATRSGMVVPMTFAGRVLGVLAFGSGPRSRHFDDEDLTLAVELARRAGTAVENARLAAERSEVARVLQEGLKPPMLPEMDGWDSAAMYQPAGEVNAVGGDFYDAFEIDGGWMLTVGDVVGRGAAAASLTALARHTIRTAGLLTGDPRRALELLDEALRARGGDALCTAAVLVLPHTERDPAPVRFVAGGHPLPLQLRDGNVTEVGRPGPLLGAFRESTWELQTLDLHVGDGLVLYTDGVIEAKGDGDRFGEHRLRSELAGSSSPLAAIGRVGRALEDYLGGEPDDDVAVIAVRRRQVGAPTRDGGSEGSGARRRTAKAT